MTVKKKHDTDTLMLFVAVLLLAVIAAGQAVAIWKPTAAIHYHTELCDNGRQRV